MKRRFDGFVWIGLGVSLLLALFLSPYVSTSPDGLEKVAETKGFLEKGEGWKLWKHAPFSDYAIPWIRNEKVSTALSGLIGTLAIFFIAFGIGKMIKTNKSTHSTPRSEARGMLRVDTERRFLPRFKNRGLAPSNVSKKAFIFILLFSLLFLTLTSTSVFAARPLTTDDAWTVEKGKFQLEMGFDASRQDNHDKELNPSMTLSYGLSEKIDVGIGTGYLFIHPKEGKKENGLSDTELKLKYRPIDEKDWKPAIAFTSTLKIPTASDSKGLGSGRTDFGVNAILTKNWSERIALHLNLGYTFIGEDRVDNELNYSLGTQFILSEKWALVGEITGVNNLNGRKGDDPFSGLLGTYYLITENIVFDVGLEIGMSKAAPDYRFTTGLTLLFKP